MKETLLKTAGQLVPPEKQFAEEFSLKQDTLAEMCSSILAGRKDIDNLIGRGNQDMARDNNRNFARFIDSLFTDYSPTVFVETVLWVFRAYRSHGFQTTYWACNLNIWADNLKSELTPDAYAQIYPFYNWLIINIPKFSALTDEPPIPPLDIIHDA